MNLAQTVVPKSDQLGYDDLIVGPRTIRITDVKAGSSAEQPVSIFFDGDNGRPYKPCKSMRRVLIALWGPDASVYVGRRLTLYGDPEVKFGGEKLGGIRISHASHITEPVTIALTVTRGKRKPYTVEPLPEEKQELLDRDALMDVGRTKANGGIGALRFWWSEELSTAQRKAIGTACPDELKQIASEVK